MPLKLSYELIAFKVEFRGNLITDFSHSVQIPKTQLKTISREKLDRKIFPQNTLFPKLHNHSHDNILHLDKWKNEEFFPINIHESCAFWLRAIAKIFSGGNFIFTSLEYENSLVWKTNLF